MWTHTRIFWGIAVRMWVSSRNSPPPVSVNEGVRWDTAKAPSSLNNSSPISMDSALTHREAHSTILPTSISVLLYLSISKTGFRRLIINISAFHLCSDLCRDRQGHPAGGEDKIIFIMVIGIWRMWLGSEANQLATLTLNSPSPLAPSTEVPGPGGS